MAVSAHRSRESRVMDEHEQQFYVWLGKSALALLVPIAGGLVWLWKWVWDRVHVTIPAELKAQEERISNKYATKEQLVALEVSLREILKAQAEQRREMHEENGRKLDAIGGDVRALSDRIAGELGRVHRRVDEHIERHHSK